MRYLPRAVGPSDEVIFIPNLQSRMRNVKLCAWEASADHVKALVVIVRALVVIVRALV